MGRFFGGSPRDIRRTGKRGLSTSGRTFSGIPGPPTPRGGAAGRDYTGDPCVRQSQCLAAGPGISGARMGESGEAFRAASRSVLFHPPGVRRDGADGWSLRESMGSRMAVLHSLRNRPAASPGALRHGVKTRRGRIPPVCRFAPRVRSRRGGGDPRERSHIALLPDPSGWLCVCCEKTLSML
jgi:hypothetical protein